MLCMSKYSLINVISCCICFIKYLILVWCIMNSECNSKTLLAVKSVCICVFIFNIVSFILNMVLMIMSILVYFHLSVLLKCWLLLQFNLTFEFGLFGFHIIVSHQFTSQVNLHLIGLLLQIKS